jgi:hypothetical protein
LQRISPPPIDPWEKELLDVSFRLGPVAEDPLRSVTHIIDDRPLLFDMLSTRVHGSQAVRHAFDLGQGIKGMWHHLRER